MLLLGAVAVFNWQVDVFGIYRSPNDTRLPSDLSRAYQAYQAAVRPAEVVLLGTSRAQIGLNSGHPALGEGRQLVLASPGQTPEESALVFEKIAMRTPPRLVVWGLDFEAFDCLRRLPSDFDARRFERVDHLRILVDLWTLKASVRALATSSLSAPVRLLADGSIEPRGELFVRAKGHRQAAQDSEKSYHLAHARRRSTACPVSGEGALAHYRHILRLAHQKHIDLRLLISPSHARQWETLYVAGLWTDWEEWKRDLVRINDEEAHRVGKAAFALWDFSGYSVYTTEPFPRLGDVQTVMRWYWESSHYKKELGDLVLNRVFRHSDHGADPDFGVRLDQRNAEAHLAAMRDAGWRWRLKFADDVAEIHAAAKKLAPVRNAGLLAAHP